MTNSARSFSFADLVKEDIYAYRNTTIPPVEVPPAKRHKYKFLKKRVRATSAFLRLINAVRGVRAV